MIDALNLTAGLSIAVSSASIASLATYGFTRSSGYWRGWLDGYSDAIDINASTKPIQDRHEMIAQPGPRVVDEGCRPAAEVYSEDDVPVSNIAPVSPEVASSVLHLHDLISARLTP